MAKLENAVDEGKIEVVLIKDLSRLGRHRTQTALFIDHLRENKVKVISVTEDIDTINENDDLLIGFKQIFNDFYAKDISKKVRAGIRQKQKNSGLVPSLPFGYYLDRNTGTVEIDNETADYVREIFRLYVDGYGLCTIAKQLNERKIQSPEYYQKRKPSSHPRNSTVTRISVNRLSTDILGSKHNFCLSNAPKLTRGQAEVASCIATPG